GPSVTTTGINANNTVITNVAPGVAPTDAVNVSQLTTQVNGAKIHYYAVNDNGTQQANYANDGATGVNALAAGVNALAAGTSGVAMGNGARASAADTIAIGSTATADSAEAVAIGKGATATGGKAISIGSGNTAYGNGAVAIGDPSYASGTGAFTGGANNIANSDGTASATAANQANGAVAIGNGNKAIGQGSVALGNGSTAGAVGKAGGVAIGDAATASANAGDVALGSGSVTTTVVGTASTVVGGTTYKFAGTTPTSTVSVGAPGTERTITNVAAGRISDTSTDAINGSQLYGTNQQVTKNTTDIANINAGAGIKYFHANSTQPDSQALGTDSVAIGPNAVANNAGAVALGSGSTTDVAVGTASTVINGTTYNFAGTGPTSTVSVGAVGAERTITNVAAGRLSQTSTDAINGSQLYATNQSIANLSTTVTANKIRYFSVQSTGGGNEDNLGAQAADAVAVGKDASSTVNGGIALGASSVSDRAVAGSTGNIPAGSSLIPFNTTDRTLVGALSVGSATTYRQITNVADGTQAQDAVTVRQLSGALQSFAVTPIQYFHANSTAADSLAIGTESVAVGPQTVVNGNNGVGIGNGAVVQQSAPGGIAIGQGATSHLADSIALGTQSSAAAVQGVALGAGTSVTQAGGVALGAGSVASTAAGVAGYVPPTATDAQRIAIGATTSTLAAVSVGNAASGQFRQITGVAAGTADSDAVNVSQLRGVQGTVAAIDQSTVKYDTNADGSVNYNSVTMGGSNATAPVTVHNVAPGVAGTDAVNVNQLNATSAGLNNRINALGDKVDANTRMLSGGIAASAAMAVVTPVEPGRYHVSGAVAGYNGQAGIGFNLLKRSENGQTTLHAGVGWATGGSKAIVRVGFGFSFD
ncbi:Head domain of trimeric autotransporter adhesin, partial [Variovorax sp. NFACC26]